MVAWFKANWHLLVVVVGFIALMAVMAGLMGCKTPAQQAAKLGQGLGEKADEAYTQTEEAKRDAWKAFGEANEIDKGTPKDSPLKPLTTQHVKTLAQVNKDLDALLVTITDLKKQAVALNEKLQELVAENEKLKKGESGWWGIIAQWLPVVGLIGFAVAAYIFIPPALSKLKAPAALLFGGIAGLYTLWIVATMIPWWAYALMALLIALVVYVYYRGEKFKDWLQKMGKAVKASPEAVTIAAETKLQGTKGLGAVLDEVDARVEL